MLLYWLVASQQQAKRLLNAARRAVGSCKTLRFYTHTIGIDSFSKMMHLLQLVSLALLQHAAALQPTLSKHRRIVVAASPAYDDAPACANLS